MQTRRSAAVSAAVLLASVAALQIARAQAGSPASLLALDTPYTQNFDTLASTGTSSVLPAGWELVESGTNANTTYAAGTGSINTGDTYSFGAAASAERALGGLQSGSLIPLVGGFFSNDTGSTITSLEISYTGEQWRLGALGRVDRIDFQYSLNATSLSAGTWIDADALDFVAPTTAGTVGALDGQAAANRATISGIITGISIPPGARFRIRWVDFNAAGADDGLAVDDFTLIPHGGGEATLSVSDASVTEGNSGAMIASFTVTISTAAHGGVTFDIATADGTGDPPLDGDYVARALAAVVVPPGQTSFSFDVTVNGDTTVEPDETFAVHVTGVSGALVVDGDAVGTIVNDDEPPPVATDGGDQPGVRRRRQLWCDADARFHRAVQSRHHDRGSRRVVRAVHVRWRHGDVAGDTARRQRSARQLLPHSRGGRVRWVDWAADAGRRRHDRHGRRRGQGGAAGHDRADRRRLSRGRNRGSRRLRRRQLLRGDRSGRTVE